MKALKITEKIIRENALEHKKKKHGLSAGGVRHDPQTFMGKTVTVPHFNRDTVEFASRIKRDESNPGIKTLLPLRKRAIWRIFKIS